MVNNADRQTNPLIIALDVDSKDEAKCLVKTIGSGANFYKVGMELYAVAGMAFVDELIAEGKKVFLDLKLYDIGETVKRATAAIAKRNVTFLTVHGSKAVMQAAVEGRGDLATKLLAVTVLTSFDATDLKDMGYESSVSDLVSLRVKNARESGIDGIVCSALEIKNVREIAGEQMTLVTPGVRSAGADTGDQKRIATPRQAMQDGANYLVIGRQVTRAKDPKAACEEILKQLQSQPA